MGLIGATFVTLSSHGAEQLIVQRVLACRNVVDGRKALVLSAIVISPLFMVFLGVGAMLWVYYQVHAVPVQLPTNDYIYPVFMMTAVPHVLKGFLIVAILSAAMSSVSSALTSLASVSTMDFVKGMTGGAWKEARYLQFSKYSTVGWAVALIIVAYLSREAAYVLNAAFSLRGLTSGALLGSLLLVLLWRKGTALPIFVGIHSC
jgi:solute:Na+ symporter, SSS family